MPSSKPGQLQKRADTFLMQLPLLKGNIDAFSSEVKLMQMCSSLRKSHNARVPYPAVGRGKLLSKGGTRSSESERLSVAARRDLEVC